MTAHAWPGSRRYMAAMTEQNSRSAPSTASDTAASERVGWWMVGVSGAVFAAALILIYTHSVPQAWIPYVRIFSSGLAFVAAIGGRRIGRGRLRRKQARA
jgi:hypothetical protein